MGLLIWCTTKSYFFLPTTYIVNYLSERLLWTDLYCLSFWLLQVRQEALQTLCFAPPSNVLNSAGWPNLRKHLTMSLSDPDATFSVSWCSSMFSYQLSSCSKQYSRGARSCICVMIILAGSKDTYYVHQIVLFFFSFKKLCLIPGGLDLKDYSSALIEF